MKKIDEDNILIFTDRAVYIYHRCRDVTIFVVSEEEETGLRYDISTTVIDMNCSIGENLDLPCKNIFPLMIASYLSKNFPE